MLALEAIDSISAFDKAKLLSGQHIKGALSDAVDKILFKYASENDFDSLAGRFDKMPLGYP